MSGYATIHVKPNPRHGDRYRDEDGRVRVVLSNSSTPSVVPGPVGEPIHTGPDNPAISGYFEDSGEDWAITRAAVHAYWTRL